MPLSWCTGLAQANNRSWIHHYRLTDSTNLDTALWRTHPNDTSVSLAPASTSALLWHTTLVVTKIRKLPLNGMHRHMTQNYCDMIKFACERCILYNLYLTTLHSYNVQWYVSSFSLCILINQLFNHAYPFSSSYIPCIYKTKHSFSCNSSKAFKLTCIA